MVYLGGGNYEITGNITTNLAAGVHANFFTISIGNGNLTQVVGQAGLFVTTAPLIGTGGQTYSSVEGLSGGSQLLATFTDPNSAKPIADYQITITWGDTTTTVAQGNQNGVTIVNTGGSNYQVFGTHTYANVGTFPISVNIQETVLTPNPARSPWPTRAKSPPPPSTAPAPPSMRWLVPPLPTCSSAVSPATTPMLS